MKNFLTLVIFICLISSLQAQRVDLDKYQFTATYRRLPELSIDTSYRTFFVTVEASPLLKYSLRNYKPAEMIRIDGWKKLEYGGHLKIESRMEDVIIDHHEITERVQILKDKNGKEVGRRSYFNVQLTYTFSSEARITDYLGNQIITIPLADRSNKKVYNSQEFNSRTEADFYFKFQGYVMIAQVMRTAVETAMHTLNDHLLNNFGFPEMTANDFLWIVDSKRHPEYDAHRKTWFDIKQAFFQMNAEESLDEIKAMLAPVITYYQKLKKNYSSSSKADKKIRYASCFNLAKIYYYLDDAENAMREAGELVLNEYDQKDGRRLEAAAAELKFLLNQSKRTTRHFSIDTEKLQGPSLATK